VNSVSGLFAAPHLYNIPFSFVGVVNIAAGATGYFIVAVNTNAAATSGNTVKIDGLANPVTFGYTTSPPITNNQTDAAGTKTILAAGITLTTSPTPASTMVPGSTNNIVYIAKMDVTDLPVAVSSIQFTLTGTHDNNDMTTLNVHYNAAAPSLAGATVLTTEPATFAAPHTYNTPFSFTGNINIAAGATGYFIITVNLSGTATIGNTIKLDGAINPVTFAFTTSPTITNNQTDVAGTGTISTALPLTLLSFTGNAVNDKEVQLHWKTAGEINTKDFEVEWSDNGQDFTKTAVFMAAGNSTGDISYSYLHKIPADGNNYYRLKMTDKDGRFTYSPIVKVKLSVTTMSILTWPNPVKDVLQIQVRAIKNETIELRLHQADGKIIATRQLNLQKGSNSFTWPLQTITAGNYFISSGNNQFKTIQILINH
jgi:hypothetical protein